MSRKWVASVFKVSNFDVFGFCEMFSRKTRHNKTGHFLLIATILMSYWKLPKKEHANN